MSTGTIPAGPVFPLTTVVTASSTVALSTSFTRLKSVKIALDGEKKNEGTRKTVSDWLKTNKKVIKDASMKEELDVSSWACVVDVEFAGMAAVRTDGTTTIGSAQKLGATGDVVAVLLNVDKGTYTQGGLHIAQTITTAFKAAATGVTGVAQKQAIVADTRVPGSITVDYTKTTNTAAAITWGTAVACGTKWKGACNGLSAPWGLSTIVQPTAAVGTTAAKNGSIRAYKWMGDKGASKSKVLSIEKDDKLNILAYEMVDKVWNTTTSTWTAASYQWKAYQYTVTGASQLVASAAALVAASQLF